MDIRDVQSMLARAGYYKGGIDGVLGPQTRQAMALISDKTQAHQFPSGYARWSDKRKTVAVGQAILNALGFSAGAVDGYAGHNTREALSAYTYKLLHARPEVVERPPRQLGAVIGGVIPRQNECQNFYGTPGPGGSVEQQLSVVELPFKLRIDWNLRQQTNRITVHKKCAPSLHSALLEVHARYGSDNMRALGLDRYAGAYNPRRMRGGTSWSMHAYGCAIDFYAQPNGLRTRCPDALFCGPNYKPFLDIMEKHGWLPAIRLWGRDAMHFQRARL